MKTAVLACLGGLLLLGGIALLVLPGPGFVLVAAGLAILATQFDWAKRPLEYAKVKAEQGVHEVARSWWRAAFAVACAVALLVVGVLGLLGVDLPLVNRMSAVLLLLSGIALIGTVVYARVRGPRADPARHRDAGTTVATAPPD
ncbi:PGPGW domain-containing protein [Nakamurella leprariae]|uniref:PGPGW domain-containing protein n=1 Tax=Nakamurella leprariae TaxID=2803911 RepID=A0A939C334_9ACTN|nr:PGPGW domain-containing protein [Nakamurella leprariae]MBM9468702.1 PGPGW domain-containing protein [Nakamurella leprariae]